MYKKNYNFIILGILLFVIMLNFGSSSFFGYNNLDNQVISSTSTNQTGESYDDTWINSTIQESNTSLSNWVTGLFTNYYNKGEVDVLVANAGGGTSFNPLQYNPTIKRQLSPLSTTDNVTWSNSDMQFDLVAGTSYNLICDILYTGQVATTGMVINVSVNGSYSNQKVIYDTWSSATAKVGLSAILFNTNLIGTGSGATIIKPNLIVADWTQTTNGTLILKFRSEIFNSYTQMERGSVCKLYNVGQLQQAPVNTPTERTPQIKRQNSNLYTTSNTVWSPSNFSFIVDAGKKYNLMCDILYNGSVATTGQVLNITTNITYSDALIVYNTWSSATAPVGLSAIVFNTALIGTGSGATIIKPNGIYADFTAVTGGYVNVTIRSEVSGSGTNLLGGSMCYLYDMS